MANAIGSGLRAVKTHMQDAALVLRFKNDQRHFRWLNLKQDVKRWLVAHKALLIASAILLGFLGLSLGALFSGVPGLVVFGAYLVGALYVPLAVSGVIAAIVLIASKVFSHKFLPPNHYEQAPLRPFEF